MSPRVLRGGVFLALGLLASAPTQAADLKIAVTGIIPRDKFMVRIVVIADPDGNARQDISRNINGNEVRDGVLNTQFSGLAPGYYGIVAIEESGANHAVEKIVNGAVSPPMASSAEIKVTLKEPSTLVTIPVTAAQ